MDILEEQTRVLKKWHNMCKVFGEEVEGDCKECEFYTLCDTTLNKILNKKLRFYQEQKHIILLWALTCEDEGMANDICKTNKCSDWNICKLLRLRLWKKTELSA